MKKIIFLIIILFGVNATVNAQTQEMCPGQPTPQGWIIVSTRKCAGCCGSHQIVNMPTIKRIDNLPTGSFLEICPGQPMPQGWIYVSSRKCAGCCGSTQIVDMPTIKKIN